MGFPRTKFERDLTMAIAFDSSINLPQANGTTLSATLINTAGTELFVGVTNFSGDNVSGVTYNSVALTKVSTSQNITGTEYVTLWHLTAPALGSHTVTITSGSADDMAGAAVTYSGTETGTVIDVSGGTASVSPIAKTLTTTINNDWTVAIVGASAGTNVAGASTTLRKDSGGANHNVTMFDSNGAITPAGNTTLTITNSTGTLAMVMAAFKVASGSGTTLAFEI